MANARAHVAAAAAALLAIITLSSTPSIAYSTTGTKWPQAGATYYVNAANLDLASAAADAAVRAGASTWLQQASAFNFLYGGPTSQTTTTNDGVNLVLFRDASSGGAIATTYWWSSGGQIIDADIIFWDGAFKFFAGTSGCSGGFFIEDIAAHEFGHALGLGHSTTAGATMYPSAGSCDQSLRLLDADDIAGVRALYPVAPPPPSLSAPGRLRVVR